MRHRRIGWVIVMGILLLTACKPRVPSRYIQPDEMEDILYDYHVGQGMISMVDNERDYQKQLYFNAVLKKHGVTRAEFDSSLVYYYTRADKFVDIYTRVQDRLGDKAMELGASSGEVERFTATTLTGDTADIWEGDRRMMLMPLAVGNVIQFSQKGDTTYHKGDRFLLTFKSDYLMKSGSRSATVYLAITYANDTVVARNTSISTSGTTRLEFASIDQKVKEIRGFFYMGKPQQNDNAGDLCLLFLDQIHLIRFHQTEAERQEVMKADSIAAEKAKLDAASDSVQQPDSLERPHRRRLGERPMQPMKEPRELKEVKPITHSKL